MAFRLRNFFGTRLTTHSQRAARAAVQERIQEGRLEQALLATHAMLATDPGDAELWYKQGNVLKDLNRPADALTSYHRAIELQPRHSAAQCNCGVVLLALGKPADALPRFWEATAIDPCDSIAYYNRGVAEQALGAVRCGLGELRRGARIEP